MLRQQLERQDRQDALDTRRVDLSEKSMNDAIKRADAADIRAGKSDQRAQDTLDYGVVQDVVEDAGASTRLPEGATGEKVKKFRPERIEKRESELPSTAGVIATGLPGVVDSAGSGGAPMVPGVVQGEFDVRKGQEAGEYLKPGFKWEQARATEAARKEQAGLLAAERSAREAQRREDTDKWRNTQEELRREGQRLQGLIAQGSQAIAAGNLGVREDLANLKRTAQDNEEKQRKAGIASSRAEIRSLAKSLLDNPDLNDITGTFEGRRDSFMGTDNQKAVDNYKALEGLLSLENRTKLKGSGAISDFESKLLGASAVSVSRAAGKANVEKWLKDIAAAFDGDEPKSGPITGASGDTDKAIEDWLDAGNGVRIRLKPGQ